MGNASSSGAVHFRKCAPAWRRVPEDVAMADHNKSGTERKDLFTEHDRLDLGIREQLRTWIEQIVQEELTAVPGGREFPAGGDSRRGYRHVTP